VPRLKCQTCGIEFHVPPSVIEKGGGKYCSTGCTDLDWRQGQTRQCPTCGKEFYAKPHRVRRGWSVYCSKQCLDLSKQKGEIRQCGHCGKEIYRKLADIRKSRSQLFFCDHSCRASWTNTLRSGENHPNWKQGGSAYRDILLRSGIEPICERCGNSDARVLAVHHLDQDRTNNRLDNLVWICHNCHHLIHHFQQEMNAFMATLPTEASSSPSASRE
jgi:hypothetical protein